MSTDNNQWLSKPRVLICYPPKSFIFESKLHEPQGVGCIIIGGVFIWVLGNYDSSIFPSLMKWVDLLLQCLGGGRFIFGPNTKNPKWGFIPAGALYLGGDFSIMWEHGIVSKRSSTKSDFFLNLIPGLMTFPPLFLTGKQYVSRDKTNFYEQPRSILLLSPPSALLICIISCRCFPMLPDVYFCITHHCSVLWFFCPPVFFILCFFHPVLSWFFVNRVFLFCASPSGLSSELPKLFDFHSLPEMGYGRSFWHRNHHAEIVFQ